MINAKAIEPDELANVNGGTNNEDGKVQMMRMECPFCHDIFQANVMKTTVTCPSCKKPIEIKG